MGNMFLSVSRPFYQSVSESIALPAYTAFAIRHFEQGGKKNCAGSGGIALPSILPKLRAVCSVWPARKGFYHAGTGRISGIQPLFRNLAEGEFLRYRVRFSY